MSLLSDLKCPADLASLSESELTQLAAQIRAFLIDKVSATGGHLGPNLGVVELTIAIHRIFDSPHNPILFDTGHISYVHKILTGRQVGFDHLRQTGGLSGYPNRAESSHDWVENSHASTALSWGAGMAQAFRLKGENRSVVVVVGDGALTGGMAWEALNSIAVQKDLRLVIIVNDNGRSYTSTVGGLAKQLSRIRTDRRYDPTLEVFKAVVRKTPLVGKPAYDLLHGLKVGLKDILAPQDLFSDLGLKYIGPIPGHDRVAVETALTQAKKYEGPVIVHCLTEKGHGFTAAEQHDEDHFHAVDCFDPATGLVRSADKALVWTDVFAQQMLKLAKRDEEIVALSAAMVNPVGLGPMAAAFPNRVFDVGIAEQHAVTCAAGMAMVGLKPVVAIYSTFLSRGFDQILMDVGLHSMPVTFVIDRAGITGPDGASHHGIWDLSILGTIPGLRLATPRDEPRLRQVMCEAVADRSGPTALRFPKGAIPPSLEPVRQIQDIDVLFDHSSPKCILIGYGPMASLALEVAQELAQFRIPVRVLDPVWALPVSDELLCQLDNCDVVVTIEDGIDAGGIGQLVEIGLADRGCQAQVLRYAIPTDFIPHGSRSEILTGLGFNKTDLVARISQLVARQ